MDWKPLAEKRSEETGIKVPDWQATLDAAPPQLSQERVKRMAEATDSPDALGTVFERIAEQGPGADDKLFQRVDESSYPLGEWMESVHVMQMWLNTHGRVATFDSMLEYIGCAAEYADKQTVQAPLTTWTEDMLKDHGYEGNRG